MIDNLEIVVVANNHRKALILDHLVDIPHQVSYTPDYELNTDWKPNCSHYVKGMIGHIGHNRCVRGHQDALRLSKSSFVLVFEDDAVPNRKDWLTIVEKTVPYLSSFEIISLHGRNPDWKGFVGGSKTKICDLSFIPARNFNDRPRYLLGSLAYLVRKSSINKILAYKYNGVPMDIFIANKFKFAFIDPSPFNHDRSCGSLIDIVAKE